ncbi:MAG: hypothetical protein Q8K02_18250 [Flavobacterium sp.]|nr:hypothetical protein [Flavobacterium sp.]
MKIRKIVPPKGWGCTIAIKLCGYDNKKVNYTKDGLLIFGHAHNCTDSFCFGLICLGGLNLLGKYDKIRNKDGSYTLKVTKPSHTLKHEYAHILTPDQIHSKAWLNNLKELDGTTKRYTDDWNFWKLMDGEPE